MRSFPKYLMLAATAATLAGLTGCFLGSDNSESAPADVEGSNTATTKASADLEANISRMSELDQFKYGKEDLTDLRASHTQFAEAVRLNPSNSKARLGLALTGVLLAGQSAHLATVINQTLDVKSPFDTRLTETAPAARVNVLRKVAAAAALPEFHVIQDAIGDTLLPALEEAITHLEKVYQDPSFSMKLTLDGEKRELDHAEAGILLAGVRTIHGLLTLWLSRDVDIDTAGSYDYLESFAALDTISDFSQLTQTQKDDFNTAAKILAPTSSFLTVRAGWAAKLGAVDGEIKSALTTLKDAVASIDKENDDQSDDLIRICDQFESGDCIYRNEYTHGRAAIDSALKYMDQPYVIDLPDLDTAISVDFSAYFKVQDYKKMLPYYGFYDANSWSDEKPVLYFTDAKGKITGNFKTLTQIAEDADTLDIPAAQVVARVRAVIHLQDPTFQGFLPGATEAGIWNLVLKQAEHDESTLRDKDAYALRKGLMKRSAAAMGPGFALSLIGR